MILLLGGTAESRKIAAELAKRNFQLLVTVVSKYGAQLAAQNGGAEVITGSLDSEALKKLIEARKIKLIVDATHPYARQITDLAWKTAKGQGLPFIRYERPQINIKTDKDKIYQVANYDEAANLSVKLGTTVFLTIGSKNIASFITAAHKYNKRLVVRVLPTTKVIQQCLDIGMQPKNIVAMQGPFSTDINMAMLRQYNADVLVTKNSGRIGGTDTKIEAAKLLGIPVIVINRCKYEKVPLTEKFEDVLQLADSVEHFNS